ncbi:MAG TPA: class I SAM-dependent methyltransferase [Intrasporangium sp.]|uniref:class I SAM-dependent methyltransferase n=1 Tax=Intrasporangium sp. TaxID=1925024 RepID=UPI002B46DCDA|nr:class I SAM-dependent methyltransferase [Intrasporangium sp.]HKX67761.1 class I SAM-dependent methyltransferase [Intrasporangium sp.]
MPVPPRFAAAVALLNVKPGDTVLEVGGGTGISAALICSRLDGGRLDGGRLIALDRSATATARTVDRNRDHVADDRLEALTAALRDLDGHDDTVDRALALNVNAFWTGPADAELEVLRRVLRPGGFVVLAWTRNGPQPGSRIVEAARDGLARHRFTDIEAIADPHLIGVTARNG